MKITIAICTRERPNLLKNQLNAVSRLKNHATADVRVVVVENGPKQMSEDVVNGFGDNFSYFTESRVGLAFARNRAIEQSLETDPDWIAFFDDDEIVDENWLIEMVSAIGKYPNAKAFAGPVNRIIKGKESIWFPPSRKTRFKSGIKVLRASTGNILFHSSVYAKSGSFFRFDQRFNLTGGEDTFLFADMRRKGIPILWIQEAFCNDEVLPERSTLRARFSRSVRDRHINGVIDHSLYGSIGGRLMNLAFAIKMLFHFVSYILAGIIFFPFSEIKGQKYLAICVFKFSVFIGYSQAIFLPLKEVYRDVDGY